MPSCVISGSILYQTFIQRGKIQNFRPEYHYQEEPWAHSRNGNLGLSLILLSREIMVLSKSGSQVRERGI